MKLQLNILATPQFSTLTAPPRLDAELFENVQLQRTRPAIALRTKMAPPAPLDVVLLEKLQFRTTKFLLLKNTAPPPTTELDPLITLRPSNVLVSVGSNNVF